MSTVGDVGDGINGIFALEEARRRRKGDDHCALFPPISKHFPVTFVERAWRCVENEIVAGRNVVRQRSNGHQTTGALTSFCDKIRLPTGCPHFSTGQKFTGGLFCGLCEHGQMGMRLNNRIPQMLDIIHRSRIARPTFWLQ